MESGNEGLHRDNFHDAASFHGIGFPKPGQAGTAGIKNPAARDTFA